jgi:hypothetical protein
VARVIRAEPVVLVLDYRSAGQKACSTHLTPFSQNLSCRTCALRGELKARAM